MYICDKCGYEHESKSACPKCGARVIVVNEDYIKRRREWEERQKNGMGDENAGVAERTVAAVLRASRLPDDISGDKNSVKKDTEKDDGRRHNKNDKRGKRERQSEKGENGRNRDSGSRSQNEKKPTRNVGKRYGILYVIKHAASFVGAIRMLLGKNMSKAKADADRRRRHANDPDMEMDIDDEMAYYEKMLLDHIVFKSKVKKYVLIGIGIMAAIAAVIVLCYNLFWKDFSLLVYYDGHKLVSTEGGIIEDFDKKWINYELKAYSDGFDSIFFEADGKLAVWHNGEFATPEYQGELTHQYMFSANGRYAVFVSCIDTTEGGGQIGTETNTVSGKYYLNLLDLKEYGASIYESDFMLDIEAVTDDGRAVYIALDTAGYSIVVSRAVNVADKNGVYMVADSVKEAVYDAARDSVLYIADGRLYMCSLDKKKLDEKNGTVIAGSRALIDDEVLMLINNETGDDILYLKENGMWRYDKETYFLAEDVDGSCTVYLLGNKMLYYRRLDTLYTVEGGKEKKVVDNLKGDIVCLPGKGISAIICLDKDGNLYDISVSDGINNTETGVDTIGRTYGCDGYSAVKDGRLILVRKPDKKHKILTFSDAGIASGIPTDIYSSRKCIYYIDADGNLCKIPKKRNEYEELGKAMIVIYRRK